MTNAQVKQFIEKSKYKTQYLPILNIKNKEVFAYEALSRFEFDNKVISSTEFFKKLHDKNEVSFILEKKNKKIQIKKSQKDKKLILHFDSNVFSKKEFRVFWKELLLNNKKQIIVEITQNSSMKNIDAKSYFNLIKWLEKNDISFAISSYFKEGNIFSFQSVQKANYVKIDKEFISKAIKHKIYLDLLVSFLKFCKENKTKTIVTHIRKNEIEFIQKLPINFYQEDYLK